MAGGFDVYGVERGVPSLSRKRPLSGGTRFPRRGVASAGCVGDVHAPWRDRAPRAFAADDRETALLNLSETQKNLWRTIENYWQNATSAQQRYIAAQQKVEAARTSFELTSEQFRLGLKNILELTTDKTLYSASVQQMLQAKYMAILNAALLRYYGGQSIAL